VYNIKKITNILVWPEKGEYDFDKKNGYTHLTTNTFNKSKRIGNLVYGLLKISPLLTKKKNNSQLYDDRSIIKSPF